MSTRATTKKRKSVDGDDVAIKKAKVAKPAKTAAPLKSALKKRDTAEVKKVEKTNTKDLLTKSTTKTNASDKAKTKRGTAPESKKSIAADNDILEDDEDGSTELTGDQTAALLAGFSSSEEDDDDEDGIAISRLPQAPTTGAVQKRIKQAIAEQDDPETTPGVIYIGRIPHGFYEAQLRAYLSQFGDITRLRLARNKKTGHSRHFGFVEFSSAAVADNVVKTMDKYLLFGHLLQVRRVPKEQIKDKMFVGAKKHPVPRNRMERELLNDGAVRAQWDKRVNEENKRRKRTAAKLKDLGYEFEMPMAKSVSNVTITPLAIEGVASQLLPASKDIVSTDANTTVERTVSATHNAVHIVETGKKRGADGKPKAKKVVKKAKIGA